MDDDIIIGRLSGRRVCSECGNIFHIKNIPPKVEGICDVCDGKLIQREDDKPDSVKKRLDVYKNQTAPLIGYYKEKALLSEIDAGKPIERVDEIISDVKKALDE